MKQVCQCIAMLALTVVVASACFAQTTGNKKSYTFRGKVEAVNERTKSLTVNGEAVKGWMEAMTMNYPVDDPAALNKVKPGDQITATVYDDDIVLHKVVVVPKSGGESKSKK